MGLLSDLLSSVFSPQPGVIAGQAQLRTPGHPSAYVLPKDQYESAVNRFGGGAEGSMVNKPDMFSGLMSLMSPTNRAIYNSAKQGPTVVLPQGADRASIQHEATHAALANAKMPDAAAVNSLLPAESVNSLRRFYPTPESMAAEVPARAMTQPEGLALDATGTGPHSAPVVRQKYLDMLRGTDPKAAKALSDWWAAQ